MALRPKLANRPSVLKRGTAWVATATLLLSCQPGRGNRTAPDADDRPFVVSATAATPALVFPPALETQPRGPSPTEVSGVHDPFDDVDWPYLDETGAFSFAGRTVSVSFDRKVAAPKDPSRSLIIDPPVAGKTTWNGSWSVQFVADDHFDPDQVYTLTLGDLKDKEGEPIAKGYTATFKARPAIDIAGKVIHYFPEAGKPKLVTMRPYDGARVGRNGVITALFDQAVDLTAMKTRVGLTVDGAEVPMKLSHPAKGAYEGVKVDKDYVLEIRPASKPSPGASIQVSIDTLDAAEDPNAVTVAVAKRFAFEGVDCGSGGDSKCTLKGGELHLPGRSFTIRLNNRVSMPSKRLARAIKVTPKVRNLSVWADSWSEDGRIHVSGDFSNSKTYRVQVGALTDRFGGRVSKTVAFDLVRPSQSASVSMGEGVLFADAATSRSFKISTRNTKRAKLALWEVPATGKGYRAARQTLSNREKPSRTPDAVIIVKPRARRDATVTTKVDLLDHVAPGKSYIAMLELDAVAFGAPKPSHPSWSMAAKPPTALVTPHDDNAIVLHAHASGDETLVHVSRLATGKPLAGARVVVDGDASTAATSDAQGLAVLGVPRNSTSTLLVSADHKGDLAQLALDGSSLSTGHFAPELTGGKTAKGDVRALIVTDRGAYRPGATVRIKATLRKRGKAKLRPLADASVRLRVVDPMGKDALKTEGRTDTYGGIAADFDVTKRAAVGRYRIIVEPTAGGSPYTEQTIQVAEFEPPRFSVDVDLEGAADNRVAGKVVGKYLFGASMDGANVSWTLKRANAPIPAGSFSRRGLSFRPYRDWYDRESESAWTRTGTGALSGKGVLNVRQSVEMPLDRGPQRFTLEAEVSDASHRTIAGRGAVVLHAADQYVGVKVKDHWLDAGKPVPFEVGVIDQEGNPVSGKTIRVELTRQRWVRTRKSGPGGSFRTDWHVVNDAVGSCSTKSAGTVSTCALSTKDAGNYRLTTFVDGKSGGSDYVWAWGGGWSSPAPSRGRTLQVSLDKQRYAPGDTAKLIVVSPFRKATALVTLEDDGMVHRHAEAVAGRAATFEVKIPETVDGPWMHATVTLLPRGGKGEQLADWKLGAVRIPLEMKDVGLNVTAKSNLDVYEPGQHVELDIDVMRGSKPAANAEVILAVVDEGVLRLTNHHAPDPVPAMHPGRPLAVTVDDNRRAFADLLARSHTGGDGPGSGAQSLVGARKKFVRTALWKPGLRTDAEGHIDVDFDLPDNLTRFRIMAVALDAQGRGGSVEDGFYVRKTLMAQPAVPRFATVGDRFEAAVMVHNNTETEEEITVALGKRTKKVKIGAEARGRVAFTINPKRAGTRTLVFSVQDAEGVERDRVVAKVPVQAPGLSERPRLSGAFKGTQQVRMEVPSDAVGGRSGDDFVTVTVGEQLWPELAGRLEYLVDYPHGCVEQTTSSTVPLLAARKVLPQMGITKWSDDEILKMIRAGVERLDTMRTSSGGLAYWPGGHEPNLYGTAYAMNAVVGAKRAGVKLPAGLLDGMSEYLANQMKSDSMPYGTGPEVRAAVALSLSEAEGLPASTADALFDTKDKQGPFGLAAMAIAMSTLPNEEERVGQLLDALEATLDEDGQILTKAPEHEFHYFGSTTRSQAIAAIALGRLRPASEKLPGLVHHLLEAPEGYTTQSTAYALLSLTEHIDRTTDLSTDDRVRVLLDGVDVQALLGQATPLGPGAIQYSIPLERLRGHEITLQMEAETDAAVGFSVAGHWRRTLQSASSRPATSGKRSPDLWRVVTDVAGEPVDLKNIEAGATLRVVLLARLPRDRVDNRRMGYLALTDRLPAGFEALQPDLWTVASVPELSSAHPLQSLIRWGSDASHVELRDDRALFYFDRVWGDYVHATYLMRATTPGTFTSAPASAELMYETDGTGYSEGLSYRVKR